MKIRTKFFKKSIFYIMTFLLVVWAIICSSSVFEIILRTIVSLIFILCLFKGAFEKELFNPYICYALVPFSLLIYNSNFSSRYLLPLNNKTWILAIIHMVTFVFSFDFFNKRNIPKYYNEFEKNDDDYFSSSVCIKHSIILFSISFALEILRVFFELTLPVYSTLMLLFYPAIAFAWKSRNKMLLIIEYVLIVFVYINSLNKSMFLFLAITTIISYWKYSDNRKNKWKVLLLIVLGSFMMIILFNYKAYLQTGGDFSSFIHDGIFNYSLADTYINSKSINWEHSKDLAMPYMYIVQGWTNLQYIMETQAELTWGIWFVKPVLGWLTIDNYVADRFTINAYSTFNTNTYIAVFFKDFGYWFSFIGSVFLAWYISKIYQSYRTSISPLNTACYSLVFCASLELFFSNHFFQQSYPFTILVLCGLYMFAFPKLRNKRRRCKE